MTTKTMQGHKQTRSDLLPDYFRGKIPEFFPPKNICRGRNVVLASHRLVLGILQAYKMGI